MLDSTRSEWLKPCRGGKGQLKQKDDLYPESPHGSSQGVLPSLHLSTLIRKGVLMQTNRTLSRSTLTVQDMTVWSAVKPTLPSIATPRCDLRPTPGAAWQPTKRRERFSRIFEHASLRPTNVLRSLVKTIVSCMSICPYGYIRMDIVPLRGAPYIPLALDLILTHI
jgi:hypothetical protein